MKKLILLLIKLYIVITILNIYFCMENDAPINIEGIELTIDKPYENSTDLIN